MSAGINFGANFSLLVMLGHGGHLVSSGILSVGNLTAFALCSASVGTGVSGMSCAWTDYNKAVGASESHFDILDGNDDESRVFGGNGSLAPATPESTF